MVLVIVLAIGFLACCMLIERAMKHAPLRPSEPSSWDVLDGVGQPRCWSTGPRGGHAYRYVNGVWVCRCCGDLRNPNPDRDLTHTEAREVHDDARRITGEAARRGGVA